VALIQLHHIDVILYTKWPSLGSCTLWEVLPTASLNKIFRRGVDATLSVSSSSENSPLCHCWPVCTSGRFLQLHHFRLQDSNLLLQLHHVVSCPTADLIMFFQLVTCSSNVVSTLGDSFFQLHVLEHSVRWFLHWKDCARGAKYGLPKSWDIILFYQAVRFQRPQIQHK